MTIFVVTGARGGIGLEYTRQISTNPGNTVIALVRDADADLSTIKQIQSESNGQVHILGCDISSDESVSSVISGIASLLQPEEKINILINNAAIQKSQNEKGTSLSAENLLSHVNSNVVGPARIVQGLLPHLAPGAVIANITSGIGSMTLLSNGRITPGITPYSISKAALNMLTVHQAYFLKEEAIVVCVDPGHVKTKMGGPNAVLEILDSARGVLDILAKLTAEDSGKFLLYDGTELPW